MQIKKNEWLTFILLSALCFGFWLKLEYPRLAFVDLSINKEKAILGAEAYLRTRGVDTAKFKKSVIFASDEWFDRYLQHVVGIEAQQAFIAKHGYDLFYWKVRFFKELQKEEYIVHVSSHTGEIVNFQHLIEDIESRPDPGEESAKQKAEVFLQDTFNIDLKKYEFHEEKIKRYEKRTEYLFSWEKKGVYIPWQEGQGGAKLLAGVTVSGNEIREYYKNILDLPEKFLRYIENQFILGEYLYSLYFILLLTMLVSSVAIAMKRRHDLIPRLTKKWFYYIAVFLTVINIADIFNNLQRIIMAYHTSARLGTFICLYVIRGVLSIGFLAVAFVMPGIAGESLCNEVLPENKYSAFSHYLKSNFFNRGLARSIIFGYLAWLIMLGLQAIVFCFGQKFLGVWKEWYAMTQFSSTYIPLLSAFIIGATASLNEEITFRLFGISWAKKYLRNSILAVILTAVIWGMGHSMYAIFPVWFRIVEISFIGIFYGFIFLRFGIIPLLVAHYLFDAFWCSAANILGRSSLYLFLSSVGVLCIPLAFAAIAYFLNKEEKERETEILLDKTQKYNLQILVTFISAKSSQGHSADMIRKELVQYGWDYSLVDLAIAEVFNPI